MNKHVAIVGPTGSGKTGLSILLAKKFNGEIVSCDSMQLYKGMDIGTATPSQEERSGIVHHLMDVLDICESYSVSDYVKDAKKVCDDIFSRGKLPIFCGGTGLYIDSYISGIQFGEYENDESVRKELLKRAELFGTQTLYDELCKIDPESALKTNAGNVKRVVRALEVYKTTGITLSEWNVRSRENAIKKDCLVIGIDFEDRSVLYDRIDKRVELMLENGLLDEVKLLYQNGIKNAPTASQAIGYKEFYPFLEGETSLEECIENLKKNSRHYAKRQLTWFKRNKEIFWIKRDGFVDEEQMSEIAINEVKKYIEEKTV